MSKIRNIVADELNSFFGDNIGKDNIYSLSLYLEQAIKAEIMGLGTIISWSEVDYVKQSDLENLFKESE